MEGNRIASRGIDGSVGVFNIYKSTAGKKNKIPAVTCWLMSSLLRRFIQSMHSFETNLSGICATLAAGTEWGT